MTTLKLLLLLVLATSQLYLSAFANPIFARSTGMQVLPNTTFAFSVDNKLNMPVHSSCSDNKLLAINHALSDLYTLSHVALTELLDPATTSASQLDGPEQHPLLTSLYFGDAKRPNSMATAVGFFTMILLRDKQGLLLRCDDPDGKCKQHSDWAGHWRGDENPGETVICDRSFTGQQETTTDDASTGPVKRDAGDPTTVPPPNTAPAPTTVPAPTNATASALPAATGDDPGKKTAPLVEPRKFLDDVCLNGWTLSESRPEVFWSTDLIHRFLHLPYISGGQSLHAAKAYPNALHLGRLEPELAAMNVANLQYFALDVYAQQKIKGGCTGPVGPLVVEDVQKDE